MAQACCAASTDAETCGQFAWKDRHLSVRITSGERSLSINQRQPISNGQIASRCQSLLLIGTNNLTSRRRNGE